MNDRKPLQGQMPIFPNLARQHINFITADYVGFIFVLCVSIFFIVNTTSHGNAGYNSPKLILMRVPRTDVNISCVC